MGTASARSEQRPLCEDQRHGRREARGREVRERRGVRERRPDDQDLAAMISQAPCWHGLGSPSRSPQSVQFASMDFPSPRRLWCCLDVVE